VKLREARRRARLTQQEMAHLIGCSTMTIARWENGERIPRLTDARKFSAITRVPLEELEVVDRPD